ncbi:MAG: histidine phosphatase family protein [Proteobacteria bacterium]|nr:histidine phosphatase family protein [Pseudomonadota bacterium]
MKPRPTSGRTAPVRLLLVRHAPAHERGPRWPRDGSRPLTPRGVESARSAALGLKRILPRPAVVLTSPLVRTAQTAGILHRQARWPSPRNCPLLAPAPGNDPQRLLAWLSRESRGRADNPLVVLVGHQPDLGQLLACCLTGSAASETFDLKKMGAALLHFPRRVRAGRATLLWLATPKMLRALR